MNTTIALLASIVSITALSTIVTGCAATADDEQLAAETAEVRAGALQGLRLPNRASEVDDSGPESLRVIVPVGGAKATVTDSSLASCTATIDASLSTERRTVFNLALEYEIDDGWNGCTFEFVGRSYKSTLEAGFSVDD
jgi:hypothetical protein